MHLPPAPAPVPRSIQLLHVKTCLPPSARLTFCLVSCCQPVGANALPILAQLPQARCTYLSGMRLRPEFTRMCAQNLRKTAGKVYLSDRFYPELLGQNIARS